jgi:nitrilase
MISIAKAAADPAGHYARPDVTRLLFNNRQAPLVLPVDRITESVPRVEPTLTPAGARGRTWTRRQGQRPPSDSHSTG